MARGGEEVAEGKLEETPSKSSGCAGVGVCVHQTVRGLAYFCDHTFGLSRSGEGKSQGRGVCVSGECNWDRACCVP